MTYWQITKGKIKMAKTTQLRMYTINKGKMNGFVKLWKATVVPLRQKHGFTVEDA